MSKKVRVGVIGTSWYADAMHLPALQSHPQAKLAAICGRNQERNNEIAEKYGNPKIFNNYQTMVQKGNLDAVIISTPDDLHYDMTMHALEAGLHVLCEKPLAMNVQQAWEMFQKAQEKRVVHMTYFTYRWLPFYRYLRDLIRQGTIGRCYHCGFWFPMGHGRSGEYRWRFDRKKANGVLGDLGSHMIDLARWLVGEIASVSAQLDVFVERSGPNSKAIDPSNDSAQVLIRFESGASGTIQTSAVAHLADRGGQQQTKLYGETGSLETDLIYRGSQTRSIIRYASSGDDQFQTLEVPESYWGDADSSDPWSIFTENSVGTRLFIDAILGDHSVEPNFYDGFKAQQVVDAALESHEKGCAVKIDNSV
jgi:predicted dehydrogenase